MKTLNEARGIPRAARPILLTAPCRSTNKSSARASSYCQRPRWRTQRRQVLIGEAGREGR